MTPQREAADLAARGDERVLRRLLAADPEIAQHWQPIMAAAFHGQAGCARALLEAGADPNIVSRTPFQHRPLHRAIEHKVTIPRQRGHAEVVDVLLAAGADPRLPATTMSLAPLALAAIGGEPLFVPHLLPYLEPLDIGSAAVTGRADRVRALLREQPALAREKGPGGWAPLVLASASRLHRQDPDVARGLEAVVAALLEHGADPNAAFALEGGGLPALFWAAGHSNHVGITRRLLAAGANPNDGESLFHAAEHLHRECMELLLAHGGDLNFTGHEYGNTPLWFLATYRRAAPVAWLLELGADPNIPSGDLQETALHAAAKSGCHPQTIELLLRHGADPSHRDSSGRTALDLAREAGHERTAGALAARPAATVGTG